MVAADVFVVAMRYGFSVGPRLQELVMYLPALVFSGGAAGAATRTLRRVDILFRRWPPRAGPGRSRPGSLIACSIAVSGLETAGTMSPSHGAQRALSDVAAAVVYWQKSIILLAGSLACCFRAIAIINGLA